MRSRFAGDDDNIIQSKSAEFSLSGYPAAREKGCIFMDNTNNAAKYDHAITTESE